MGIFRFLIISYMIKLYILLLLVIYSKSTEMNSKLATFGGGCFWCIEACLTRVKGVTKAVSGYAGGTDDHANYTSTCNGSSNHAEVVQISYNEEVVNYKKVLETYFLCHDASQKNKQGNDVGPQYRSVILYHDEEQKLEAEKYMKELNSTVYNGEAYHQDYAKNNPNEVYVRYVVQPKVEKFE